MALEILKISKKVGGALFSLVVENHLYHLKTPKISFTILQPAKDNTGRYEYEKVFLDVKEVFELTRAIRYGNQQSPELMKSFKGGYDKKYDKIVARIFKAEIKKNLLCIIVELTDGIQSYVLDRHGQKVPGVVKPAGGGTIIKSGSIALSRNEALFLADMLDKELASWRTVLNFDFMSNPQKYHYANDVNNNTNNR